MNTKSDQMEVIDYSAFEEAYAASMKKIREIAVSKGAGAPFDVFFADMAGWLLMMDGIRGKLESGKAFEQTLEEWKEQNLQIYEILLPENYDRCWANPRMAQERLGEAHAANLCVLAAELYELPGWFFESAAKDAVKSRYAALGALSAALHLFTDVYAQYAQYEGAWAEGSGGIPEGDGDRAKAEDVRKLMYEYFLDRSGIFAEGRVSEGIDPERNFALSIVMKEDLSDLRYLFRYGEYITENELELAGFLNRQSEEQIDRMARTFTEGFRIGFVKAGKDLSKKRTVCLRYPIGFERVVRAAVRLFEQMGLKSVLSRRTLSRSQKIGIARIGYSGAPANQQFEFDHKEDQALFLDEAWLEERLERLYSAYKKNEYLANTHAGPAVIEMFGETPFAPEECKEALHLSAQAQKLSARLRTESARITNQFIISEERSFTVIAFPSPQIGPRFEEIFRDTMEINTLDSLVYERIQQYLIDALDKGKEVHVTGRNGSHTDLTIALSPLTDPSSQTNFENCTADLNIPVGEVFTSPKLEGTNGVLHVSQVYLNGLDYQDLSITFTDGMISDYSCGGFPTPEEGRAYVRNTILYQHDTLPIGEFAIGTNTMAYAMTQRYGIGARMPILIAEKCGPHFAVGDTCYCWSEDMPVFNPDGKEVTARDNSVTLLRKTDPGKAYFGCHTDITIPYSQLGRIEVIQEDGTRIPLLEDGRFVLPGTEALNDALDKDFHTT